VVHLSQVKPPHKLLNSLKGEESPKVFLTPFNCAPKSPKGDLKDKNLLCLAPFRGLGAQLKATLGLNSLKGTVFKDKATNIFQVLSPL
jgi:hypothetical protein